MNEWHPIAENTPMRVPLIVFTKVGIVIAEKRPNGWRIEWDLQPLGVAPTHWMPLDLPAPS